MGVWVIIARDRGCNRVLTHEILPLILILSLLLDFGRKKAS
jgi:hypothetical protein